MSQEFPCPHCGARYSTEQVSPGFSFTCGACGGEVTAPGGAPATAVRPHGRPGRRTPARTTRSGSGAGSKRTVLWIAGGAAGLLLVVVVLALALDGGSPEPPPPPEPTPVELAEERLQELGADELPSLPATAYRIYEEVSAEAEDWEQRGKPAAAVQVFEERAAELRRHVLDLDPDHAELRAELGHRQYTGELEPYLEAAWLTSTERTEVRTLHKRMLAKSERSHGWLPESEFEPVDALVAELKPRAEKWDKFTKSAFYKSALKQKELIEEDLDKRLAKKAEGELPDYRGVKMVVVRPFVFFVQKDPGWDPVEQANRHAATLSALEEIILHEFGEEMGLEPLEDKVIPILVFRNYEMYQWYARNPGAYAHFEPLTGRLAVHDQCDHTTIMHEGTHQLMWAHSKITKQQILNRSFWYQEGIAEWYSGASRRMDPETGSWTYDIGAIHKGRMDDFKRYMTSERANKLFPLKELIGTTYKDRPQIAREGRMSLLYDQAWFLIYFLNTFNVDEAGRVDCRKPGVYRDRWRQYVKAEFNGRTGLKVFLECLEISEEDLKEMEKQYWRYRKWVQKKLSLRAVEDSHLVHWTEQTNRRGMKVGEAEDAVLPSLEESLPEGYDI